MQNHPDSSSPKAVQAATTRKRILYNVDDLIHVKVRLLACLIVRLLGLTEPRQ